VADGRVVDLRWVQTHVAQTVTYRSDPVAHPVGTPVGMAANVRAASAPVAEPGSAGRSAEMLRLTSSAEANVAAAQQAVPYATVAAKLRSWTRERDARR
jgi:hypothetical protein